MSDNNNELWQVISDQKACNAEQNARLEALERSVSKLSESFESFKAKMEEKFEALEQLFNGYLEKKIDTQLDVRFARFSKQIYLIVITALISGVVGLLFR